MGKSVWSLTTAVQNSFPLKVSILYMGRWAGGGQAGRRGRNAGSPSRLELFGFFEVSMFQRHCACWKMSQMCLFCSRCVTPGSPTRITHTVLPCQHTRAHTHVCIHAKIPNCAQLWGKNREPKRNNFFSQRNFPL